MSILETHRHILRFRLDNDAPNKYIVMWKSIKNEVENSNNLCIVDKIKEKCKLTSNKNLLYLQRTEGGLGGNNNNVDKQIRFRTKTLIKHDNDICMFVLNTNMQKWSYDELDDIIRSLIKVLNEKMKCECINGCIEIVNYNTLNDNYLDSDSDYE